MFTSCWRWRHNVLGQGKLVHRCTQLPQAYKTSSFLFYFILFLSSSLSCLLRLFKLRAPSFLKMETRRIHAAARLSTTIIILCISSFFYPNRDSSSSQSFLPLLSATFRLAWHDGNVATYHVRSSSRRFVPTLKRRSKTTSSTWRVKIPGGPAAAQQREKACREKKNYAGMCTRE